MHNLEKKHSCPLLHSLSRTSALNRGCICDYNKPGYTSKEAGGTQTCEPGVREKMIMSY